VQTLGKYQLGELLGQGGMGAVYRSFHPLLNRQVAIKVMLGTIAADPEAHQRFIREAQVVAALSHPHIVNIFDVDVQNGQPYIVMDFVESGSLAARLRAGPLPLAEVLRLMIPLAEALEYAHRQGLIHRDLKPANVLLRSDGGPVLADFGLARAAQPDSAAKITATGAVLGTLAYMAPEQFSGQPTDARADIYALGVMLFEMLTGRPPFDGDSAQIMYGHLQQPPPAPRMLNPALPDEVERLVLRMLSKSPAGRPQSAAEVAAALRDIQAGGAATGATIALPNQLAPTIATRPSAGTLALDRAAPADKTPAQAPRRRSPILLAGAIAAIIVAVLAAVVLATRPSGTSTAGGATSEVARPTAAARPTQSAAAVETDPTAEPDTPTELEPESQPLLTNAKQAGPEQFSVGGLSYKQAKDSIWFFGEVRNDGKEERETIKIRINLFGANGKEVASKVGFASRSYLKPGEISPFSVLFSDADLPPPFADYQVEVSSSKATFQPGYTYRDLSIAAGPQVKRDQYGFIKVSGRVRNSGEKPAKFVQVFAVFYDRDGNVVGIGNSYAEVANDAPLDAGADARFELQGIVFSAPPARYHLFVEGSAPG
jgi:eukaryotic-like serine/threonine-protein kinase